VLMARCWWRDADGEMLMAGCWWRDADGEMLMAGCWWHAGMSALRILQLFTIQCRTTECRTNTKTEASQTWSCTAPHNGY
jgi:hypothetical protein